ncbi:MAG: replication-associated recombination protein A [Actinobacteria bacterium]|nr:replication-associated recombination protein A [Actinomycetota bacterium]MBU1942713.1 replication-associated recombination protein A [Actinomycetota bacterium]MBU2686035.1 replication-associated recombination protein A [Actinomycetota bacterium]
MRPLTLEEFEGQEEIVGPGGPLRAAIEEDAISSIIFWGPPGSGKTTLARIIAGATASEFVKFSAVTAGVPELRKIIAGAKDRRKFSQGRTILFVDEIHRFNKAQQDAFLPHVEDGTITLIGATTENPSFEVISPLLSRVRVYVLEQLGPEHLERIVRRALSDGERGLGGRGLVVEDEAVEAMVGIADGDARIALNLLEMSASLAGEGKPLTGALVLKVAQEKTILYDKSGEEHFNLISALHKSVRDSDPDGSLYWLGRMLEGGEDPLYIARRLIRMATEDVGVSDPQALPITVAAMQACHFMGMPECDLALAEAVVYLAAAPKSNSLYAAYGQVKGDVRRFGALPVPLHIRNAPTRLMKDLGYGRDYRYAHNYEDHIVEQQHLPDALEGRTYYHPSDQGFESRITERLERWRAELKKRSEE